MKTWPGPNTHLEPREPGSILQFPLHLNPAASQRLSSDYLASCNPARFNQKRTLRSKALDKSRGADLERCIALVDKWMDYAQPTQLSRNVFRYFLPSVPFLRLLGSHSGVTKFHTQKREFLWGIVNFWVCSEMQNHKKTTKRAFWPFFELFLTAITFFRLAGWTPLVRALREGLVGDWPGQGCTPRKSKYDVENWPQSGLFAKKGFHWGRSVGWEGGGLRK